MKKIVYLLFILFMITSCAKKDNVYHINDEIDLSGTVSTSEVIKDGETHKINILNLDTPIIIDNVSIHKIELSYDKELKENSEVSIKGIIENGEDSLLNLDYLFSITDIDNLLSIVNTYSNDTFSITIPKDLIKISTVTKIENGFIIYSSNNINNGGEVFRILAVTNKEFQDFRKNNNLTIEKVVSNKENTIIIIYPTTDEYSEEYQDDYEKIVNSVEEIKQNVKLK